MERMETLESVGDILRARSDEFRDAVHQRFYQDVLEARQVFPISLRDTHRELAGAVAWVMERTPRTGALPPELLDTLRHLGRDHRRHGFPAEVYPAFAAALQHGLRTLEVPEVEAAGRAVELVCSVMAAAAQEADREGIAPVFSAEVQGVQRRSRRISVVRLEAGLPVDYRPGQHLPVTTSYLPGVWRMLSPALPSNDFGQLEFHIRTIEGSHVSQLLATPKVGDYWNFGAPSGGLSINGEQDVLMIAHGTGLAPLRAILFDMLDWPPERRRPRVHLFVAAEYPGELYDLMGLWNLAMVTSWLSVVPVVEHDTDPWWVGIAGDAPEVPRGLHLRVSGQVGEVVASYGAWADRQVLVVGEATHVHRTVAALIAGETPAANIQTEAWELADQWPRLQDGQ